MRALTKDVSNKAPSPRSAKVSNDVSSTARSTRWHALHQTFGNQSMQRLLQKRTIQAKLHISQPNDPYEQEADRVAERVMRTPDSAAQRKCAACSAGGATCPSCEEETRIRRKSDGAAKAGEVPADFASRLGGGTALDSASRAFFEPRFGRDFGDVRVHAGAQADIAARSISARAFTLGRNVAFAAGEYDPRSERGRDLMAHELAHVLQQRAQRGAPGLQARVVDDDEHLPCRATAGRGAAYLGAREAAAATMAAEAATALRASPIGEPERRLLWERLRLDYNEPVIRCRQVAEVADRLARAAREIRGTDCVYQCAASGEPEGECRSGRHDAYTHVGLSRNIDLCDGFWLASSDDQEAILLHEWMHYLYLTRGLRDQRGGGFDTADCYAIFADARRRGAAARDDGTCPARAEPVPAADPSRQTEQCPGNVFATFVGLGGYAYGLGGHHYGLLGAGLDLNFPLTRMHDWELTLGPRFTALLPTDAAARASYLEGIRAGVSFRYRPWRFGIQVGGYAEAGRASLSNADETRTAHPYLAGGVTAALNFRLGDRTALQILADVGGGTRLDRIDPAGDEARRGWFGVGLGLALQIK